MAEFTHDLRAPINSAKLRAQLLFRRSKNSDHRAKARRIAASIHGDRFLLRPNLNGPGICDADAIRRILDNLGSNAVKYGAKDAPVTIRLHDAAPDAIIEVHNLGREIPAEKQSDLFQLFRRSSDAEQGSEIGWGAGLSLVYGLAKARGGTVGVKSEPGEGTTFQVQIPYASQASP